MAEILVDNKFVIEDMIRIDSDPDLRCGTRRMTAQLQLMGYIINKKKVARLMKENGLTKKDESKQRKLMPGIELLHL